MNFRQIGTCVVYDALGGGLGAHCLECEATMQDLYEYSLARKIAEHSRTHALYRAPVQVPHGYSTSKGAGPVAVEKALPDQDSPEIEK